jgi:hypothetical protein
MAYPSNYYTPGGNLFTSTQNGVTTGMGGSVAPAPAPYTPPGGSYTNFASQLEGLRNGAPSSQVFANGVAGGMPTPTGGSFGSNMDSYYGHLGIDQNANPFQGQLDRAFGVGNSPFQTYAQENPAAAGMGGGRRAGTGGRPDSDGGPSAGGMGGEYGLGSNPYQGAQADALAAQQQQFLDRNFAGIRSNSVGVGGLGGSRQGVAQGEAIGSAATGLAGATANLYGANWNQDQNRDLTRYGMDQGFYTANRGLDQSGVALGASLMGQANNGDWSGLNQANGIYSPWSGFGTSTNNSQSGGGAMGALGGGLAGFGFAGQNGWWK